jgi:hypothetical protein
MQILATHKQLINSQGMAHYRALLLVDGREHLLSREGTSAFVTAYEAQRFADQQKARIISLIRTWLKAHTSTDGATVRPKLSTKRLNSRAGRRSPSITELI